MKKHQIYKIFFNQILLTKLRLGSRLFSIHVNGKDFISVFIKLYTTSRRYFGADTM